MPAETEHFVEDDVPYPTVPVPASHPDRLATIARLYGVAAADPATSRYLDLGCGTGLNLLALAAVLPDAHFVGVDRSGTMIAHGVSLAARAGLTNVELHQADIHDIPGDRGTFDYVVSHGVYSWVPDATRERLLALTAALLAEHGVAYVSFNALPFWHVIAVGRQIARRAIRAERDPAKRVAKAREALLLARDLHRDRDSAYAAALQEAVKRVDAREPVVLYHDDLADEVTPFSLEQVAAAAAGHGLAYLAEAEFDELWEHALSATDGWRVKAAAGSDPIARQSLFDAGRGIGHKTTLFVRTGAQPRPSADLAAVQAMHAAAVRDAPELAAGAAADERALDSALREAALMAIPIPELAGRAQLDPAACARAALRLAGSGHARLHVHPPAFATVAGDHPEVTPLARVQASSGTVVTTLRHEHVVFDDPLGRLLVHLLDGTRDHAAIAADLARAARDLGAAEGVEDALAGSIGDNLAELARLGLLVR